MTRARGRLTQSSGNTRPDGHPHKKPGHRSSAMINRYKRTARSLQEVGAGTLALLDQAIPELGDVDLNHDLNQAPENLSDYQRPQRDSNPCYSLERAVSWAWLDDGDED